MIRLENITTPGNKELRSNLLFAISFFCSFHVGIGRVPNVPDVDMQKLGDFFSTEKFSQLRIYDFSNSIIADAKSRYIWVAT